MTQNEWTEQPSEFRALVLSTLPDAVGINPDEPWATLPYWLRRHIAHFVHVLDMPPEDRA
jgi:hypothetical protein